MKREIVTYIGPSYKALNHGEQLWAEWSNSFQNHVWCSNTLQPFNGSFSGFIPIHMIKMKECANAS